MVDGTVIERIADAAWPAEESVAVGPWKLRATRGVSRRANSVFTVGAGSVSDRRLESMIEAAEEFYAERSLPPCFYLSPYSTPGNLESALIRRGYVMGVSTQVWTGRVAEMTGRGPARVEGEARCSDDPDELWFDCSFSESPGKRPVQEAIARRVPAPRRFVSMVADGMAVSCGMGVSSSGYTGIFCMGTREAYRRKGLASAVLRELTAWAQVRGDQWMYLQVLSDNFPAQALYRRMGMGRAYDYHYRVKMA